MRASTLALCGLLALASFVSGCASEPVDYEVLASEEVGGAAHISSRVYALIERALETGADLNALAVSGGGQNGAFGAGVMQGWSQRGRPSFQLVTGVSTGAFIATRAFLEDEEADRELRLMYTSVDSSQVLDMRIPLILFTGSLSSDDSLEQLIGRWFDDVLIDRVALASRGGERVLLVGTTNLRSGRLQFWDMSRLARDKEYDAFRRVLLASASIPVLFPPVRLGGVAHVDGGVRQHVFTPYGFLTAAQRERLHDVAKANDYQGQARLWVLVNAALGLLESPVDPGGIDLATRSVAALLDASLEGNLWRLFAQASLDGVDFRMVSIPQEHLTLSADSTAFDPAQMRRLFEVGFAEGLDPEAWRDVPPPPAFGRALLGGPTTPLPRGERQRRLIPKSASEPSGR